MHYPDLFSLRGQTAIVTGGTSRFGTVFSKALAQAGANVIIASRNVSACQALADELTNQGYSAVAAQFDLSQDESIEQLVEFAVSKYGHIDVLVCNAVGRAGAAELDGITRAMLVDSVNVNVAGQLILIQKAIPHMLQRGKGNIILMSSTNAMSAPKFSLITGKRMNPINYTGEKWEINGLTKWLAAKYGKLGIRVNALCPGTYDPSVFQNPELKDYVHNYEEYNPIPRFMNVDEVAGPLLFLASEASSYCTGVLLPVDGGYSI